MTTPQKLIRSFGRIKSRKLSDHKKNLFADLLPKYEILEPNFSDQSLKKYQKIYLEIGFGFGDFLFENAKRDLDTLYIGGETHINGIVNLLAKLEKEPLENIKIFKSDIRLFLEKISPRFFDKIYILFPDPWPKSKHFKRRLINTEFLTLLSQKIKPASELIIASDHDSYKKWIMQETLKSPYFTWTAKSKSDWQNFPPNWIETKYQKKAEIEGRISVYLNFIRNL